MVVALIELTVCLQTYPEGQSSGLPLAHKVVARIRGTGYHSQQPRRNDNVLKGAKALFQQG